MVRNFMPIDANGIQPQKQQNLVDYMDINKYRIQFYERVYYTTISSWHTFNFAVPQPRKRQKTDKSRKEVFLLLLSYPSGGTSGTTNNLMK
jgi:hypothetical protein